MPHITLKIIARAGDLIALDARLNEAILANKSSLGEDTLIDLLATLEDVTRIVETSRRTPVSIADKHDLLNVLDRTAERLSGCLRTASVY